MRIKINEKINYRGCYTLGKEDSTFSILLKHKPFIFHRIFMKLFLGFKWEDIKS
jgi:hypothetical protein